MADYLRLFGVSTDEEPWYRPVPRHPNLRLWGAQYHHPEWHNDGNPDSLMPTITEDKEDDDPQEYTYILTGNADMLGNIKPQIDSLCQRFGLLDNELGLFVPLGVFMRVLVGTSDYRGNIMRVEKPSPECLVLHVEADNGAPLLYALRQCFPDIKVEMKGEPL